MEERGIDGWPGYTVTSSGEVRSDGKTLAPYATPKGYLRACLWRNGRRTKVFVHRLVLTAFRGPPEPGEETCHLNGVRSDNRLCNLTWGSRKLNAHHRRLHGNVLRGEGHGRVKLTEEAIHVIRWAMRRGVSAVQLAKLHGVHHKTVHLIHQRETWQHLV